MEGARQLGFEFRGRTRSHLTVAFQGHQVPFDRLFFRSLLNEGSLCARTKARPGSSVSPVHVQETQMSQLGRICSDLLLKMATRQPAVMHEEILELGHTPGFARICAFVVLIPTLADPAANSTRLQVTHEILVELEFSSDRARMSVVARAPDGTIRLLTKGSDAVMLPRLRKGTDAALLQATNDDLHAFSVKGLRTLVVASKVPAFAALALPLVDCTAPTLWLLH